MNLNVVASQSGSSVQFHDLDSAVAARRRRRKLFILLGLTTLSWLLIGVVILSLA